MINLMTHDDAYHHLRLDTEGEGTSITSPDDPWLDIFIPAVSEAVASWVKDEWRLYMPELDTNGDVVVDSNGDPIPELPLVVRPKVKAAALIELAAQYRYREGEGQQNQVSPDAGYGYVLNKTSTALLASIRKSTVA
jgi:hypothetical protein